MLNKVNQSGELQQCHDCSTKLKITILIFIMLLIPEKFNLISRLSHKKENGITAL